MILSTAGVTLAQFNALVPGNQLKTSTGEILTVHDRFPLETDTAYPGPSRLVVRDGGGKDHDCYWLSNQAPTEHESVSNPEQVGTIIDWDYAPVAA